MVVDLAFETLKTTFPHLILYFSDFSSSVLGTPFIK